MTVLSLPPFPGSDRLPEQVFFDRHELAMILSVYGRRVAAGEWRDYAIAGAAEVATFSIFRRAAEYPLYRVEKRPKLRGRQGMYALLGPEGQMLRRGQDLAAVLRFLDRRAIRVVE